MKSSSKKISIDEKLSMYLNYNLISKCVEIMAKKEIDVMHHFWEKEDQFGSIELRQSVFVQNEFQKKMA